MEFRKDQELGSDLFLMCVRNKLEKIIWCQCGTVWVQVNVCMCIFGRIVLQLPSCFMLCFLRKNMTKMEKQTTELYDKIHDFVVDELSVSTKNAWQGLGYVLILAVGPKRDSPPISFEWLPRTVSSNVAGKSPN